MVATTSSPQIGWKAAEFDLEGPDGRHHRLAEVCGPKGTLVMFICNHCPYVQAVLDDIIRDARELEAHGVGSIAIMPNDTRAYPADSLENMKRLTQEKSFRFPMSSIEARKWRGPMTRYVRPISSASMERRAEHAGSVTEAVFRLPGTPANW